MSQKSLVNELWLQLESHEDAELVVLGKRGRYELADVSYDNETDTIKVYIAYVEP